jgi:hypothetical protein
MKTTPSVTPEKISQRAHQLWEQAGKPQGSHNEHWLQAEQELKASEGKHQGTAGGSVEPGRNAPNASTKAPHSSDYQHPGATTDAIHHHRQG